MIELERTESRKTIKEKLKSIKKGKARGVTVKQSPFMDKIFEIQQVESIKLELDRLIEEIDLAGKEFAQNPTLDSLRKYKTLIKSFLELVVKNIYKVKEKFGKRYWLKQKVYVIIEKINHKLEKLTNYILEKESEHIDLLATLDEIRGLLIDLYK